MTITELGTDKQFEGEYREDIKFLVWGDNKLCMKIKVSMGAHDYLLDNKHKVFRIKGPFYSSRNDKIEWKYDSWMCVKEIETCLDHGGLIWFRELDVDNFQLLELMRKYK